MKAFVLTALISLFAMQAFASSDEQLDKIEVDITDKASLQRGARTFVNYCLSCHEAAFMRYNRMAKDIGLTDEQVKNNLMFATDNVGETMTIAMRAEDANRWFGMTPPDLSVIARARGTDWLYTYLRTFYLDKTNLGTNNSTFKNVAMPHILWEQQGYLTYDVETELFTAATEGQLDPAEYNQLVYDLVNFLAYIGEPSKLQRMALAKWVLLYLILLFIVTYAMKKAYWKDVH